MELTVDGSYSMWNSLSKLEKEWNLQGWLTKTQHSLGVFYFNLGGFQGVWHTLWKLTWKGISLTTLLVFFLEQSTAR